MTAALRPCQVCGKPRPSNRAVTCSAECGQQRYQEKETRKQARRRDKARAERAAWLASPTYQAELARRAALRAAKLAALRARQPYGSRAAFYAHLAEQKRIHQEQRRLRIEKAKAERHQKRAERQRIKELRLKYSHLKFDLFPPNPQQNDEPRPRFASATRWDGDIDSLIG